MTVIQQLLAKNIKVYRKRLHLTQADLARRIDSAASYISQIELGIKFPSPKMIEKIAMALEIPSHRLFRDISDKSDYISLESALIEQVTTCIHNVLCNQ